MVDDLKSLKNCESCVQYDDCWKCVGWLLLNVYEGGGDGSDGHDNDDDGDYYNRREFVKIILIFRIKTENCKT